MATRPASHGPHAGGPTGPGSVLLEIGGDRGALVVRASAEGLGREVEIRRLGAPWAGHHAAVRERVVAGRTFAALFGSLPAAPYEVRWRDRSPADGSLVDVRAGSVSETALPGGRYGGPDPEGS